MSKILVVDNYDAVSSLIHGTAETLAFREFTELPEDQRELDGRLEVVTGVTMFNFDEESGKLEVLQVQVPDKDENGEETNNGGTFCTFGGSVEEIDFAGIEKQQDETGEHYSLNIDQFISTMTGCAIKSAEEVLGTKLDISVARENVIIFQSGKPENGLSKLVVSLITPVSKELIQQQAESQTFNKDMVNRIGAVGIDIGMLLTSFNLSTEIENTLQSLGQQHGVEPLSVTNIRLTINNCLNQVLEAVTYEDIRKAVKLRKTAEEVSKALTEDATEEVAE